MYDINRIIVIDNVITIFLIKNSLISWSFDRSLRNKKAVITIIKNNPKIAFKRKIEARKKPFK
jgi:hypothetical protein